MHTRPTRSQALGAIITDAVLQSRLGWRAFAAAVVEHFHATTEVTDRVVEFHVATTADNYERCAGLNTQTVRRMVSGEKRMPSDIEESLIAALPPEWAERAHTMLLDRAGLMLARKPAGGQGGAVVGPCQLMRHTADVLEPMAQALVDNVLDARDAPLCREALEAVGQVMGTCVQLEAQLRQVLETAKVTALPVRARA